MAWRTVAEDVLVDSEGLRREAGRAEHDDAAKAHGRSLPLGESLDEQRTLPQVSPRRRALLQKGVNSAARPKGVETARHAKHHLCHEAGGDVASGDDGHAARRFLD